jgi:hypothetical protein
LAVYIAENAGSIINYDERLRNGERISTHAAGDVRALLPGLANDNQVNTKRAAIARSPQKS